MYICVSQQSGRWTALSPPSFLVPFCNPSLLFTPYPTSITRQLLICFLSLYTNLQFLDCYVDVMYGECVWVLALSVTTLSFIPVDVRDNSLSLLLSTSPLSGYTTACLSFTCGWTFVCFVFSSLGMF